MEKVQNASDPYSPCYCQSGKKYRFCHHLIDSAPARDRRELSQKLYIQRWGQSSSFFQNQGCYEWIASQIASYRPEFILDIGCGDGTGIAALRAVVPDARIISCDDNLQCLQRTRDRLNCNGVDVVLVERLEQSSAGENYHQMRPVVGKFEGFHCGAAVNLIQADVIWDTEFETFIKALPKFDAITVWLIGTYDLKPQSRNLKAGEGNYYRLTVQNKVYQLANAILRVGGVLHIVDRGEAPPEKFLEQEILDCHREQAEGTTFEVLFPQFREYDEPAAGSGIPTIRVLGKTGRVPKKMKLAMSSIIAVKR